MSTPSTDRSLLRSPTTNFRDEGMRLVDLAQAELAEGNQQDAAHLITLAYLAFDMA